MAARIAQVGLAGRGGDRAGILSRLGVLSAVCDPCGPRYKEYAERYAVAGYGSVDDLLASERFGAAVVCTPAPARGGVVAQLLGAKKHVFVEGPPACGPDGGGGGGGRLHELAAKNGVVLESGNPGRSGHAARTVKGLVASKRYGDLVMLGLRSHDGPPPDAGDTGIMCGICVQDIDTAMWMFEETPNVVFARSGRILHEYEDVATVTLGFGGGRAAVISSSWTARAGIRRLEAVCTGAVISSDLATGEVGVEGTGNVPGAGTGDMPGTAAAVPKAGGAEPPLQREIQDFVGMIKGGPRPGAASLHAANAARVAEAALLSSRDGTPIHLDLK